MRPAKTGDRSFHGLQKGIVGKGKASQGAPHGGVAIAGLATNSAGNVLTTGITDGSLAGTNVGFFDIWLAEYDPQGIPLWKTQFGTVMNDYVQSVATDSAGNIFITGDTYGTLTGSNAGQNDIWLAKYDSQGIFLWNTQLGTADYDFANGVDTDTASNVYITGTTYGSLAASNPGGADIWVAKYGPQGTLLWKKQVGTSANDLSAELRPARSGSDHPRPSPAPRPGPGTRHSRHDPVRRHATAGRTDTSNNTGDAFGYSLAVLGDRLFVGAPSDDVTAQDTGSVFVFDLATGAFIRNFDLGSARSAYDNFGDMLAAVGTNLLVGVAGDDDKCPPGNTNCNTGAAYLFDSRTFNLLATFYSPDPKPGDRFGFAVAAVGDDFLVTAPYTDVGAADAGAAFLFDGSRGALLKTIANPDPGPGDLFGWSAAQSGGNLAIGAPCDGPPDASVAWWAAEGDAKDKISGKAAALQGPVGFDAQGASGQAVRLNGSTTYINAGNDANLNVSSGDFSVEACARFDSVAGDMSIVDKMSATAPLNADGWTLAKDSNNRFVFGLGGGGDGRQTVSYAGGYERANDVAIQPDGKIIMVGRTSSTSDFFLARLHSDGRLDASFGSGGKVSVDFHGGYDVANAVALLPDGKIVVAGVASGSNYNLILARRIPDGSFDRTFDSDGWLEVDFAGGYEEATDLMILPDGRMIVVGYVNNGTWSSTDWFAARFTADGAHDAAFFTRVDFFGSAADYAHAVGVQPDGKVLVTGSAYESDLASHIAVARLGRDGGLDPTFSRDGKATLGNECRSIEEPGDAVTGLADGKILVAGTLCWWVTGGVVIRLDSAGNFDSTFGGGDGIVQTGITNADLVVQPDGRLLVAGQTTGAFDGTWPRDMSVARLTATGVLDTSFSGDGITSVDFFGRTDRAYAVAIQPDGKIVAVGEAWTGDSSTTVATIRLTPQGDLDHFGDPDVNGLSLAPPACLTPPAVWLSTLNSQPSTLRLQASTLNLRPSTLSLGSPLGSPATTCPARCCSRPPIGPFGGR